MTASPTTPHNSHYYDGLGIRNVYVGQYVRANGEIVKGESLNDLLAASDPCGGRRSRCGA